MFYSTVVFYIMILVGALYSADTEMVVVYLGRYLIYLALPTILLFSSPQLISLIKEYVFKGFVIGIVTAAIYLNALNLIHFYSEYHTLFNKALFDYYHTYHSYTAPLKIHPTYFGMYVLFGLVLLLNQFKNRTSILKTRSAISAIMLLLITLVFINSRICLVVAVLIGLFVTVKWAILKSKTHLKTVVTVLGIGCIALGIMGYLLRNTYMFSRVTTELKWDLSSNVNTQYDHKYANDSRISRWEVAGKLIEKRAVIGYGTGSEKRVLKEGFINAGLFNSAEQAYDAHSQWISIALEFGLLGVFLFSFYMFGNLYRSCKRKEWDTVGLFTILLVVSITENIFKNNAGFLFIALLTNLTCFTKNDSREY